MFPHPFLHFTTHEEINIKSISSASLIVDLRTLILKVSVVFIYSWSIMDVILCFICIYIIIWKGIKVFTSKLIFDSYSTDWINGNSALKEYLHNDITLQGRYVHVSVICVNICCNFPVWIWYLNRIFIDDYFLKVNYQLYKPRVSRTRMSYLFLQKMTQIYICRLAHKAYM